MVNYRRNRVPGGTYFFTVTLADRRARLLTDYIDELRAAFSGAHHRWPFITQAIIVLPDHLHTIWSLPSEDSDYAARWRAIKTAFTRTLAAKGVPLARNARGEYHLWQRRYWEHSLRDDTDLRHHLEYIWFNPVKHGYVRSASAWPYSSFHREVRRGLVAQDWGGTSAAEREHGYGE